MTIPEALTAEIERRDISHRIAGEMLGVTSTTVSNWVNGLWQPKAEHTAALAQFLRLNRDQVRKLRQKSRPKDRLDRMEENISEIKRLLARLLKESGR